MRVHPTRGWLGSCAELDHECAPQHSGLPGRRRDFLVQCQAKARRCQRRNRGGLNHLQTSPPTGQELVTTQPTRAGRSVEAQATWRVLLENRKSVTKGEDLRLQRCTGPKTGGYPKRKGRRKRAHYGKPPMISRMIGTPVFSDRTEFPVTTDSDYTD